MADLAYTNDSILLRRNGTDWGAIWAGMFTFIAIWSVFGLLGMAIFTGAANPAAEQSLTGMGIGMAIWAVVLTIIAMFVAGWETARLASVTTRHHGLIHGMIMFGLSVVATLLITLIGTLGLGATEATAAAHSPYLVSVLTGLGWVGFFALFLGWLAAMLGATSGASSARMATPQVSQPADTVHQMRPAA
jgi:hypothetical protein